IWAGRQSVTKNSIEPLSYGAGRFYASSRKPMSESRELRGEVNPDDLEPTIDIDLKTQKRILILFSNLEKLDHYELLGVSTTDDKKVIKNAYFDRMNEFHVDKFYGKN